ncbi:MAG: hypothetical protein C4329_13695 [Chitinophagaceae bacterium]
MPYNLGNEDGTNMDMVLKVYDFRGNLLQTINDPSTLAAYTSLSAGRYYISISAAADDYAPQYGMMGKYTISVQ